MDLRKRKLITLHKVISYEFQKGPKFAPEFLKEETDLTADMLARFFLVLLGFEAVIADLFSGAWKNVKLKPYNFKSKGALISSGALHPRMRFSLRPMLLDTYRLICYVL